MYTVSIEAFPDQNLCTKIRKMEWLSCCRILILPFPVRCHHAGQVCRTMQVSYHASVSYHAITQGKCVIPFKCHTMQVSYHSSVVPCKCVVPCHHAGQVCHTIYPRSWIRRASSTETSSQGPSPLCCIALHWCQQVQKFYFCRFPSLY